MAPPPRLMLLDSASMYFRAFHGVPDTVTSPDGLPIGAVRGFLDAVARMLSDHPATELVACFDADWRPDWRVALLPSYKAHRVDERATDDSIESIEEVPDALLPQVPIIEDVLDAIGISRVGVDGFEADDVIGTLAVSSKLPVDIVTGDRDLFQLVDDEAAVNVLYIGKGFAKAERVNDTWIKAKYGITAASYADFATLRGDPSDGLPGVRGVGDKSAAAVVDEFSTIEVLLEALRDPDVLVPFRAKIESAEEYLVRAIEVVRVRQDVPIPPLSPALPKSVADPEKVIYLAERWGLARSIDRVVTAMGITHPN
ncbi:MAG: 5'-3' exonuclease H3TH domain-containing protein [Actinomycetes bacterium]